MKKLFLIDGMALIYRSYYAFINNPLSTSKGFPTSAIYGFLTSVFKILKDEKPDCVSIAMDAQKPTFRHEMYSDYKANRKKMPDDLRLQIPEINQLLNKSNFSFLKKEGYEADDIIATVVNKFRDQDILIYIVTGDKDIMQLVNDKVFVYNPGNKFSGPIVYDQRKVYEKWSVTPNKICDLLSIMGDNSDNIPGVKGVGPKTASKLVNDFDNVPNLLKSIEDIANPRIKGLIDSHKDDILMANELVKLKNDVPVVFDIDSMDLDRLDFKNIEKDLLDYEMPSILGLNDIKVNNLESIETISKKYNLISNKKQFNHLKEAINGASVISFDLETTDINPLNADIVGI